MENGEKRKKFLNQIKLEEKSKAIRKGLLGTTAAIGITASMVGCSQKETLPILPEKKSAMEEQKTDDIQMETNATQTKQMVDSFEDSGDVLKFLKNEYIEEYEKKKGESELTIENISFLENPQDYVYVNSNTGDFITHGDNPYETQEMLEREGIPYEIRKNVKIYEVHYCPNDQDKIIDAMSLIGVPDQSGINKMVPVKVIMGSSHYQAYDSVLTGMQDVIPKGMNYAQNIEKDETSKEMTKSKFNCAKK